MPPNKRLKLTGGDRFNGNGVLCPWRGPDCRPTALRRRAGRPQLKRDPLGGALPPHEHSLVNSFWLGDRTGRRASIRTSLGSPRPTPQGRATGLPRRTLPSIGWLLTGNFPTQGRAAGSQPRAARSSLGAKRAV